MTKEKGFIMKEFGYRNERHGFRLVLFLVALLALCVVLAIALFLQLSKDFKNHNPGINQSTMNGTGDDTDTGNSDNEGTGNGNSQDLSTIYPVNINNNDGKLVIVIDAGHDACHVGAEGHGVDEEVAVLTIAKYCYEELLTYEGVEVYMTRMDGTCPGGGKGGATKCNATRVENADDLDADLLVSLHLNVLDDESFGGAIVYYPNANYVDIFNTWGEALSRQIMDELVGVGLADRGIRTQNSKDGSLYPDDSLADYYGIIRGGKEAGILSVIVEHAFVSNADDVNNFLNSEQKLKELGIADATAIAKYYGLEKK